MVCLGNICRSPLAEGILRSKVDTENVFIDSAGTGDYHIGHLPDKRSIEVAKKYGIDITYQRARRISVADFENFDVIYAMDTNNFKEIVTLARNTTDAQKVKLILNESNPGKNRSVPDPYFDEKKGFEDVFKMLDKACEIIANKI
jgi:protein-tyrosine phosphatase